MADDKNTIAPIDLDMSLDDIEDLPSFTSFPTGAYHVTLEKGFEEADIGEHKAITMPMTLVEVVELLPTNLNIEGENPPKVGDIATIVFMLDNKVGIGKLKETMAPFREVTGASTVRGVCAGSKGMQALVVVQRTYDKVKDRHYNNIKKIGLV